MLLVSPTSLIRRVVVVTLTDTALATAVPGVVLHSNATGSSVQPWFCACDVGTACFPK